MADAAHGGSGHACRLSGDAAAVLLIEVEGLIEEVESRSRVSDEVVPDLRRP